VARERRSARRPAAKVARLRKRMAKIPPQQAPGPIAAWRRPGETWCRSARSWWWGC